ncbi:protein-L-isoaspartate O-methyltransferase [Helicobacter cetorum]|uniref:Protein-L-isoaspartate O-methyltransferase n=1 Tax=Helicobacter cetorum (strain ATCC BAA-429 / MIT 00-7128) TaxID=182217 RepID=I0EPE1_HELC0|nr:protein-L-isoaspartate O-methyltransferase [Helicobacter cetorum]AFI04810.1 protein-L-isoaspartate O-methyltransferase [Helicobacter cetorum MIT 00-7128]
MKSIKNRLMCEEINKRFSLHAKVRKAMESINREIFVPKPFKHFAYTLNALSMQAEQYISSPLTVAKMTQYLQVDNVDSVLEIGCGSGYQAAVLSQIFRRVFSIERIESLYIEARSRIKALGFSNVHIKLADGNKGWEQYAPYDRILFSACAKSIPQALIDQLEEGGILVAPMQENNEQVIKRFIKRNGVLVLEKVLEKCLFVPILDGVQ